MKWVPSQYPAVFQWVPVQASVVEPTLIATSPSAFTMVDVGAMRRAGRQRHFEADPVVEARETFAAAFQRSKELADHRRGAGRQQAITMIKRPLPLNVSEGPGLRLIGRVASSVVE